MAMGAHPEGRWFGVTELRFVCLCSALFVNLYIVFTNVELLWSHIVAHFVIKYPKRVRDDEKIER